MITSRDFNLDGIYFKGYNEEYGVFLKLQCTMTFRSISSKEK